MNIDSYRLKDIVMNYKEMAMLISKVWLDSQDIMKLCSCGKDSAIKIRHDIENKIIESGKLLPPSAKKIVPTKLVLEYIGLDENYIFDMASKIV